ncbi:dehydrogenase/reductase SDR family member 4 [Gracilaria domingensis]|nr:dehydrogenase/reductase SDR family member 4 [Gracilaria domingensis]
MFVRPLQFLLLFPGAQAINCADDVGHSVLVMTETKLAIITASTSGIGFAIATNLYRLHYHVLISSRSEAHVRAAEKRLQELGGCGKVTGVVCHVSRETDRMRLFQYARQIADRVDALILNAAISPNFDKLLDVNDEVWNKVFDVNVTANFRLCKMFRPMLKAGSSILFVTSLAAYFPIRKLGVYSISKTALLGIVKVLADELADDDIRVNAVAPGLIRTRFSSALWKDDNGSDLGWGEREDGSGKESSRLRRSGCVDDVATVAAFLVSEQSRFVSGEIVVVAGATRSRL